MWERKVLSPFEEMDAADEDIRIKYRDWLLGGENFEWRIHREPITNNIVLERR